MTASRLMPAGQVGRSMPRLEARQKVTGRAEYVHNLRLPGMLTIKVFRSTVAHGRILSIDVSAAAALEGVHAVFTGEDMRRIVPEPYYGPAFHDQPVLALGKVRGTWDGSSVRSAWGLRGRRSTGLQHIAAAHPRCP